MLIRLGQVRPTGTGVVPASPGDVPAERRRAPLPTRDRRSLKLVERNKSLDRLMEASRPRLSGTMISFVLAVLLPTVFAAIYYIFIASPQYQSEFRFSVRTEDVVGLSNTGMSSAALMTALVDNFLIADFVTSRDAVDSLEKAVGIREIYSRDSVDWLSRFGGTSSEELVAYWGSRVDSHFDMTTGINIVQVRAFTPEDAHRIATHLMAACEALVNGLSDKARKTQMDFAEEQLQRAQDKLQELSAADTDFRTRVQSVDASKSAEANIQLASKLRGEVTSMRAELETLKAYLDADSPRVRVLASQLDSAVRQLAVLDSSVDATDGGLLEGPSTTAKSIAEYEELKLQKQFAAKIYEATLTAYEHARMRAASNTLYLATYVAPSLPQDAAYPRRVLDTFLFFLGALGIWAVGTLIFLSVRDHAT